MATRDETRRGECEQNDDDCNDAQKRVRTIQREEAERRARSEPASQAAPRERISQQEKSERRQEGIDRRLEDQDLVKRHDANECVEDAGGERRAAAEKASCREENERDRGRSERDLHDLHREK